MNKRRALELIEELRDRGARERAGMFVIEGVRFVLCAGAADTPTECVVTSPILLKNGAARAALGRYRARGVPVVRVSPEEFRRHSLARRASGVMAVVRQQWVSDEELSEGSAGAVWLGIRHLRTPGNLGMLVRTAEALEVGGVVCLGKTLDPYDPACVRASMGSILGMRFIRTTHRGLASRRELRPELRITGLDVAGSVPLWSAQLEGPLVVMLGHERHGLTDEERELCDELVTIPMGGMVGSLNAGVAASVAMYEVWRRRGGGE